MTLHFYIARRFFATFAAIFMMFCAMIYLIDLVENLRKFTDSQAGITGIMALTLLAVPQAVQRILPLITAIAGITLFINLARSSELVVSRAAGRSAMRSLSAPVLVAFVLGLLAVALLNPITAATSRAYEFRLGNLNAGGTGALSVSDEGLWLRQGGANGQTVINAAHADLDGTKLSQVTFLGLGKDGRPSFRIDARTAVLTPGAWALTDAKVWQLDKGPNPERTAATHATLKLPSSLTREQIRDSFGTPSAISIWDLPHFIHQLEAAGFSALSHRVWFQSQLALPLTMVAMVMIAAAFTLRHTRMGRTGLMVLMAMLSGFVLYFIGSFAQILADNGQIPVALGAWVPPVAGILLPLSLLLHLEDG